ncbi:MAG: hypothetical protein ACREP4_07115 [Stenotrophomonas sp.]|uniref:hypothetical protein n=1 Tax=Stenotrophomonas sp. TaxID=69392 RepID=UPI003D6D4A20
MNWALEVLELEQGADERTIKRAYARLLRGNRPDDDPEAFQRLHEAYQTALQWHRYRQDSADEQEEDTDIEGIHWTFDLNDIRDDHATLTAVNAEAVPVPQAAAAVMQAFEQPPAPSPEMTEFLRTHLAPDDTLRPQPIDVDTLVERIVDAARTLPPNEFDSWLHACPELWSLSGKADAGSALLGRFYREADSIGGANFDLIATAFGWDEVGTHVDPDTLASMREGMRQHWIWQAGNEPALALQLQTDKNAPVSLPETRRCRMLLTRPWHRMQALLSAVNPAHVHMMRSALQHVGGCNASLPCPPLREEQVQFWRDVSHEDRLTSNRVLLGLMRSLGLIALWLLLPSATYLLQAYADLKAGSGWPPARDLVPLGLAGMLVMLILGMGLLPWKLLLRWLTSPGPARVLLALLGLAAIAIGRTQMSFLGAMLGGATLWIIMRRALRNSPKLDRLAPVLTIGLFVAAPFVTTSMNISYAELTGGLTLVLACVSGIALAHRNYTRARA